MWQLLLGILLGIWIAILSALLEKYKMANHITEIFFAIVTIILIVLFLWPIVLNKIQDANPKLWLKINKMFVRKVADENFWERLAQQEEKQKKGGKK